MNTVRSIARMTAGKKYVVRRVVNRTELIHQGPCSWSLDGVSDDVLQKFGPIP
jgi:hypothetical protein